MDPKLTEALVELIHSITLLVREATKKIKEGKE